MKHDGDAEVPVRWFPGNPACTGLLSLTRCLPDFGCKVSSLPFVAAEWLAVTYMCGRMHAGATRQHSQKQAGSGGATKDPAWAAAGPALEVEAGMYDGAKDGVWS